MLAYKRKRERRREAPSKELQDHVNASVVRITALAVAAAAGVALLLLLVLGPSPGVAPEARSARITVAALLSAAALVSVALARHGLVRYATGLMGGAIFLLIMAAPIALEIGVHSAGLPILAVLIMFAGFLVSPAAALAAVVAGVAAVLGLYWAEAAGILAGPTPATAPPPLALAGALVALFIIIGWLTIRYSRLFENTIASLEASRRDLEATVAAQRAHEAALYEAKEAAESANLAKSRFLATMSHEIRTPMNGVLGMAQLLLMPDLTEEERHEYARTILDSGGTLMTLLNDILDLSKIEAGKADLELDSCDPRQIAEETVALFAEPARSKGLGIDAAWHGPAGRCYRSDPVRLRQMLSNLVSNAIKFTERGRVIVEAAEIRSAAGDTTLEFAVTDTGIGIPQDRQALLFHPFSQVDSSTTRAYGGSGLGLSIVRSLARLMGGDVGVESDAGKGARFWFRIPADILPAGKDSLPAVGNTGFERRSGLAPGLCGRVLVVEDNPVNRIVAEGLLARLGTRAACADNGQEAVDAVIGGMRPDLVLMDVQMPVIDGFTATERIRRWEKETGQPRVPIVALTAGAFEEDRQRCSAAGMDDFLAKPLKINDLASILMKWMGPPASTGDENAVPSPAPRFPA